ncbi:MAG TPA: NmrA family NAD(P)-binding protein [Phnomibacter sp.]|nr:NmrA family NAD(P)-binding protein [Phnomibacter sp.]
MKKVAIIGATGMLGQPVTRCFIDAGHEVSILARNEQKAKALYGDEVRVIKGSLEDKTSLDRLLKDKHWLYLSLSVKQSSREKDYQPEREGLTNALHAAREAGISRIGYLSSLVQRYQGMNGYDWWVFRMKEQAVSSIKQSGIPYSIFYPSTFMENFDKGQYVMGNKILLAGRSLHKMYFISGNDYGKQVVSAFERNLGNNEYVIQGPEGLTADEAAAVYARHYTKKKLGLLRMPMAILDIMSSLAPKFNYGAKIIRALNEYPEKFEAGATWEELGRPATTLENYARYAE